MLIMFIKSGINFFFTNIVFILILKNIYFIDKIIKSFCEINLLIFSHFFKTSKIAAYKYVDFKTLHYRFVQNVYIQYKIIQNFKSIERL